MRITHPFHPLSGRKLACVGERYNRYGMTLLLQIDDESACSVPPQWTDVVAVDPEIAMGGHRSLFRVVDEAGIAGLVPKKRGPRGPHKLQGEVLEFIQKQLIAGKPIRARELAKLVREKFDLDVHPRTIERAVAVKKTPR